MISSTTTVYLSGAKVLALRYPFYVMSRRVKWILRGSLAFIAVFLIFFEIVGVGISSECFHETRNVFPLFVISVNQTSWKVACFSRTIQIRATQGISKRAWDNEMIKPHLLVFFITAILSLVLSGLVIWEIVKINKARTQDQGSNQKSGVVTTLLLNLGNVLNAIFCALDLFLELDFRAQFITSTMNLIFFPMILCSFCPLVITIRGSKVKEDMKGSFAKAKNKTVLALRHLS